MAHSITRYVQSPESLNLQLRCDTLLFAPLTHTPSLQKYKNDVKEGFSENQHIFNAIQIAFFADSKAIGFRYPDQFNPVPNHLIAFILTVVCPLDATLTPLS